MKGQNSKMRTVFTSLLAALAIVTSEGAETCYFRPDSEGGSGAWNTSTRWKDGQVPNPGDQAFFDPTAFDASHPKPMHVTLSGADWEFAKTLGRFQARNGDVVLTLDVGSADIDFPGQIYGGGAKVSIVKTGSGAFRMTNASASFSYSGRIVVSNGTFTIGRIIDSFANKTWPMLEIQAPGVLELPGNTSFFWIQGLVGNGTLKVVDGGTLSQLCFVGKGDPSTFSGTFGSAIPITMGYTGNGRQESHDVNARQSFVGNLTSATIAKRFYSGWLGAEIFGTKDMTESSLGASDRFNVFGDSFPGAEIGIRNLGTVAQTTDRDFRFLNNSIDLHYQFHLDGGAFGGVTFTGKFQNEANARCWNDRTVPIILEGSNTTTCVIAGDVEEGSPTNHLVFVKRGCGTWRFADNAARAFKTPVIVERGTLEYETIADAGVACSLGLATCLTTNWNELATAKIPYAVLLGDGTAASADDLAKFAYVGAASGSCSGRKIGVVGSGCVDSGAQGLTWNGVEAAVPGASTLVLDGAADGVFNDVVDGAGSLTVEKRGAGTWTLADNVNFSGGITVKAGTLKVAFAKYTWYKFTVTENWGDARTMLGQFGLWDADGRYVNTNLAHNAQADGHIELLQPGEAATAEAQTFYTERDLQSLFKTDSTIMDCFAKPVLGTPSSHLNIVMRLPVGAKPAVRYDIFAGTGNSSTTGDARYARDARSWQVFGSRDGKNWDPLSTVISNAPNRIYKSACWYSDYSTDHLRTPDPGFGLSSATAVVSQMDSVSYVSVSAGATLDLSDPVSTSRLVCNATGGGTIRNVRFAASGTVEVSSTDEKREAFKIPMDLSDALDVENLSNWTVCINGKRVPCSVRVRADGLEIVPTGGLFILYR